MAAIKEVIKEANKVHFPRALDTLIDRLLSDKSSLHVPSKCTVSRGLLALDVALMMLVQ